MRKLGKYLPALAVAVQDGKVSKPYGAVLGPLEGARAEVTDVTKAQMIKAGLVSGALLGPLVGPAALLPGLLRKGRATAFVVLANGTIVERQLHGNAKIRQAQADAVWFNAAAGRASVAW